jgi:hypothetical protein
MVALILAILGLYPRVSGWLAFSAFLLGLDALAFIKEPLDESGGNNIYVDHLGSAFYIWEMSFLLIVLSRVVPIMISKTRPQEQASQGRRLLEQNSKDQLDSFLAKFTPEMAKAAKAVCEVPLPGYGQE